MESDFRKVSDRFRLFKDGTQTFYVPKAWLRLVVQGDLAVDGQGRLSGALAIAPAPSPATRNLCLLISEDLRKAGIVDRMFVPAIQRKVYVKKTTYYLQADSGLGEDGLPPVGADLTATVYETQVALDCNCSAVSTGCRSMYRLGLRYFDWFNTLWMDGEEWVLMIGRYGEATTIVRPVDADGAGADKATNFEKFASACLCTVVPGKHGGHRDDGTGNSIGYGRQSQAGAERATRILEVSGNLLHPTRLAATSNHADNKSDHDRKPMTVGVAKHIKHKLNKLLYGVQNADHVAEECAVLMKAAFEREKCLRAADGDFFNREKEESGKSHFAVMSALQQQPFSADFFLEEAMRECLKGFAAGRGWHMDYTRMTSITWYGRAINILLIVMAHDKQHGTRPGMRPLVVALWMGERSRSPDLAAFLTRLKLAFERMSGSGGVCAVPYLVQDCALDEMNAWMEVFCGMSLKAFLARTTAELYAGVQPTLRPAFMDVNHSGHAVWLWSKHSQKFDPTIKADHKRIVKYLAYKALTTVRGMRDFHAAHCVMASVNTIASLPRLSLQSGILPLSAAVSLTTREIVQRLPLSTCPRVEPDAPETDLDVKLAGRDADDVEDENLEPKYEATVAAAAKDDLDLPVHDFFLLGGHDSTLFFEGTDGGTIHVRIREVNAGHGGFPAGAAEKLLHVKFYPLLISYTIKVASTDTHITNYFYSITLTPYLTRQWWDKLPVFGSVHPLRSAATLGSGTIEASINILKVSTRRMCGGNINTPKFIVHLLGNAAAPSDVDKHGFLRQSVTDFKLHALLTAGLRTFVNDRRARVGAEPLLPPNGGGGRGGRGSSSRGAGGRMNAGGRGAGGRGAGGLSRTQDNSGDGGGGVLPRPAGGFDAGSSSSSSSNGGGRGGSSNAGGGLRTIVNDRCAPASAEPLLPPLVGAGAAAAVMVPAAA